MRAGIIVNVAPADRRRLEVLVSDRNAPQKHVWRARIILATADGCGTTVPPWGELLKPEEIEALWAYVVTGEK